MLKNNTVLKIVSLVLAICLWAFVIGEVNPTVEKTVSEIPVELTNVDTLADRGLALSSDEEYYTSIVVKGSRSDLNSLEISDIHATADVYGYEKGDNHISVEVALPDGISLEEIKTPEITVTLENLQSVYVPVTIEFTGEVGENMEPAYNSYAPSEVEVKGAESVIAKVDNVRVQLDAGKLSETWEVYSAAPTAWTKKGKIIKNVTISAQTVEVEAVMHHIKQVPLELKVTGSPDEKYGEYELTVPEEITVRGNAYALERVTSISAESIDISGVTESTVIEITPDLPEGVALSSSSEDIGVKIEFK